MRRNDIRVGVLSFHNSKETKAILNAVSDLGHTPVWLRKENLKIEMTRNGPRIEPEVDVVVNRLLLSKSRKPIELLGIANAVSACTPVLNEPDSVATALNKIASVASISGVPKADIPKTVFSSLEDMESFVSDNGSAVYKKAVGTHGDATYAVEDGEALFSDIGGEFGLVQERIDQNNIPSDVRVYVVGGEIIAAMKREAAEGEWKTNIAKGGNGVQVELPWDVEDAVKTVCKDHGLDYAGVDIMEDGDGNWKFLEVNPTAGFKGLFNATGVSPASFIAAQAIEKAGCEVSNRRVRKLALELDDSVPSCKPPIATDKTPTIGLTVKVHVAGHDGMETVKARVDTGAARSSVDVQLASELGIGPICDYVKVKSGSQKETRTRPVAPLTLNIANAEHTVEASIEDREHMSYPLILGRDVLASYRIDPSQDEPVELDEE